jgi:hypothetical protein
MIKFRNSNSKFSGLGICEIFCPEFEGNASMSSEEYSPIMYVVPTGWIALKVGKYFSPSSATHGGFIKVNDT